MDGRAPSLDPPVVGPAPTARRIVVSPIGDYPGAPVGPDRLVPVPFPAPLAAVLSIALLAGCPPPCPDPPVSLQIGTGEDAFEPIAAPLPVVNGPQGGWHVFGSLEGTGLWTGGEDALFDGTAPTVTFGAVAEGFVAGYEDLLRPLVDTADGVELAGELLVWDVDEPSVLDGLSATLRATVVDACGVEANAEATATLTVP